jgi:hypothetical protein
VINESINSPIAYFPLYNFSIFFINLRLLALEKIALKLGIFFIFFSGFIMYTDSQMQMMEIISDVSGILG